MVDVVPNVVGLSLAIASADITAVDLTVGDVTQAYSSTVAVGLVISQSPVGGTPIGSGVNFVMTAGHTGVPCCACPCNPPFLAGFNTTDVGAGFGTLAPSDLNSIPVWAVDGNGSTFNIIMSGTLPQNEFTSVTVTDSLLGSVTFNTAVAIFNQGLSGVPPNPPITIWQWVTAQLFADPGTYHLTVT